MLFESSELDRDIGTICLRVVDATKILESGYSSLSLSMILDGMI